MRGNICAVHGLLVATLAIGALVSGSLLGAEEETQLSAQDEAAIRRLIADYPTAWLVGDAEAVMKLFSTDAVLLPHHGVTPVEGEQAIRAFWWPVDSPPSAVTKFTFVPAEVSGRCGLAYARGRFSLTFSVEENGENKTYSNSGNFFLIARKSDAGQWRIARLTWNDPVPQER